ncbi:MAG: helix-hairpin-helix domain-containing protein [Elusimicrobia bacterium]|nr:helix-hairpin-helix domain-containing protein [Elusimicrobiota bacterium]
MDKARIAAALEEIAALLELKGDNPFRVRAYYNAARIMAGLQGDLDELCAGGKLSELRGIGKDLAGKIAELHATGRLRLYEELKASLPAGLLEMTKIPGFGPKRAKLVHDKLKVAGVDALEAAAKAGRVAALAGFGEKSQAKLLESIAALRRFSGRHLQDAAQNAARTVLEVLRKHREVVRCDLAGSLRRGLETIGDLDFLASAKPGAAEAVMRAFTSMPSVARIV